MRRFVVVFLLGSLAAGGMEPVNPEEAGRNRVRLAKRIRRDAARRGTAWSAPAGRAAADPAAVASAGGYVGGSSSDEVLAMARDKDGNLILAGWTNSPDFKATGGAVAHDGGNAFVQKMKADGSAMLWRALLGGSKDEEVDAVAVDGSGAVYVAGWTASLDLPTTAEAFQRTPQGREDGFVAKLSADGKKLEYCTYLGGGKDDWLNGIAVDASGQAAVTGYTSSSNFPAPSNSARMAYGSGPGAIIARLDAAGKSLKQGTVLAGNGVVEGMRILAPEDGTLLIGGYATATDLPMVKAWQKSHQGAGQWQSDNGGLDWKPAADGMRGLEIRDLALDAKNPQVLYAATSRGMFRSTNGGASWKEANVGISSTDMQRVAIDPSNPQRLFAAAVTGSMYRTVDGGASWTSASSGLGQYPYWVGVDPKDPKTAYVVAGRTGISKTTDGGDTWLPAQQGLAGTLMTSMAIHPETPNVLFAAGYGGLYRSDNSGATWTRVPGPPAEDLYFAITFDPRNAQTIYLASLLDLMYKSTDGGASWRLARTGIPAGVTVWDVQPHPKQADVVYSATDDGLYRSANGGLSWTPASPDLADVALFAVRPDPVNPGVVHAGGTLMADGFFLHLDKDGLSVKQSSYLGGAKDEIVRRMAVDKAGDIYLAGATDSDDFPVTAGGWQARPAGDYDAFLVRLDRQGGVVYSGVFGGRLVDTARGLAVGDDGTAWLAGITESNDFPASGGTPQPAAGGRGDIWVAKVSTAAPRYVLSTVLGGTGLDTPAALEPASDGVWVAGYTTSRDLAAGMAGLSDHFNGGLTDGFLLKVSGLAAAMRLDAASVALEVQLGGSETVAVKRLKAASPAGMLPLQVKVAAGAPWLSAKVEGGEIVVSGDAAALAPGEYKGSLEVSAPAAGVAAVTVAVTLSVKPGTPPSLAPEGVLHAARMAAGAVSPGLVIRLRGEGFAPGGRREAPADAPRPVLLGGVRVLVNGVAAPLEWVDDKEIAAIVPYAAAGTAEAAIVVERGTASSAEARVAVAAAAPGLFTRDGSGEGPALANNEDGTANSAENPAERGRPVVLWGTGEGITDPAGVDGALALDALPKPQAEVEVLIGGQKCDVYYAGAQPGKPAGYLELNVKVPEETAPGAAVPVVLRVGGAGSTRTVTIAVK